MEDIYQGMSDAEIMAAKGKEMASASLKEEVFEPLGNWWEGQKEKPYIRDIERYYESPGTTPFQIKQRQQAFDDALKGLGITEEEAEKYRIGQ